jgi:hypothetical protein
MGQVARVSRAASSSGAAGAAGGGIGETFERSSVWCSRRMRYIIVFPYKHLLKAEVELSAGRWASGGGGAAAAGWGGGWLRGAGAFAL